MAGARTGWLPLLARGRSLERGSGEALRFFQHRFWATGCEALWLAVGPVARERENKSGVGVTRFGEAGGWSWGADRGHPKSQRPAAARRWSVAMLWALVEKALCPSKSSPIKVRTNATLLSRACILTRFRGH